MFSGDVKTVATCLTRFLTVFVVVISGIGAMSHKNFVGVSILPFFDVFVCCSKLKSLVLDVLGLGSECTSFVLDVLCLG